MEKVKVRLLGIKNLSSSLYLLQMEKIPFDFRPGQHITITLLDNNKSRVYSIASGINDNCTEILIREISGGDLSVKFRNLKTDNILEVAPPTGYFCLPTDFRQKKIVCISTGSGIAPFRSFVKSYPDSDFTIIHGIRNMEDAIDSELSVNTSYITCTSRTDEGQFQGRVTDYIKTIPLQKETHYYLCGNGNMIYDIYSFLKGNKITNDQIHYEEYYSH
jgi:ferredoxin-NADP reductase